MIRQKKGVIVVVDGWENINSGVREYDDPQRAAAGFLVRVINDDDSKLPIVAEACQFPQVHISADELEEFILSKMSRTKGLMIGKTTTTGRKPTST